MVLAVAAIVMPRTRRHHQDHRHREEPETAEHDLGEAQDHCADR